MTCRWFEIRELVPRHVYEARGDRAWQLLDAGMLAVLDRLRERFGPMIVNNWHRSGEREWSGLRTPGSPYYSPYSQHSFGRAFDVLFLRADVETVRQHILANPELYPEIGGVELDVSWLHIDGRNVDGILRFNA